MSIAEKARQYRNGIDVLKDWLGDGANPVEKELAQTRANTCLQCLSHTTHYQFTETIANAVRIQIGLKNKLQLRVDGEKQLHTCSVCGCAMRLKVHVPIEHIALDADERKDYPECCWLLKES